MELAEGFFSQMRLSHLPIPVCWAPSYVTLFFFFFLEGEQHELSKYADGSKFFWVVKCQTDGNKRSGIY